MKKYLLKALEELLNEYDAYYFINKYSNFDDESCTHHKQFMLLKSFIKGDKLGKNALIWIRNAYDCHYKEEILASDDTAFSYLKKLIERETEK